jgi:hypothetical protein
MYDDVAQSDVPCASKNQQEKLLSEQHKASLFIIEFQIYWPPLCSRHEQG